jgi:hypothetical protein
MPPLVTALIEIIKVAVLVEPSVEKFIRALMEGDKDVVAQLEAVMPKGQSASGKRRRAKG